MKKNSHWYSILVALFIVWFLLVLAAGVFRLVLNELQDNKWRNDYLKAQYAAEAWIELALLKIKNFWYGVIDDVPLDVNNSSVVLSEFPLTKSKYKGNKDPLVSYSINTKTQSYTGTIEAWWQSIVPLFYVDKNGHQFDAKLIHLWSAWGIIPVWNIVWNQFWLSGEGNFSPDTMGNYKYINGGNFNFDQKSIRDFLDTSISNYLIIFNPDPNSSLTYTLSADDTSFFTEPIWEVVASWKVGSYKQNIKVTLDNTAYLNILKYSLFGN